jgi:light-regulated signal transduction histidine kinase (bacteriophytochrome)
MGSDGKVLGAFGMYLMEPGNPTPANLEIIDNATQLASIAIERDRAEQRLHQRAEELAQSNLELERFAYIASHDLQEPLRMVITYTQLLERAYHECFDTRGAQYLQFIVEGATRMKALVDALLEYARIGRDAPRLERVACAAVLDDVLTSLHLTLAEAQAQVTWEPLPTVHADRVQLGQVLQNLLTNAIKFRGAAPPRIHLSACKSHGQWQITCTDNGMGFAPEYAERIFLPFQRLYADRHTYPGSGIGLAICKKIIEAHGGRIWAESVPDQGATFRFTIPAAPKDDFAME